MKIYFAAFVWGKKYIEDFLSLTLPAQLAKSNIPSIDGKIKYVFFIRESEKKFFKSGAIDELEKFCEIGYEYIDDVANQRNKYNNLGLIQSRAIGKAVAEEFEIFFPVYSDLIFSANAIPYSVEKIKSGKSFVFSMAPQVIRKKLHNFVQEIPRVGGYGVELEPINLTKFVLDSLHPIRAPSVFSDGQLRGFPSVFFINTELGYIGKAFHLHPVAFRLTNDKVLTNKFIGTLDEHFIPLLIDSIEQVHVVDNTAQMCLCSYDEYEPSDIDDSDRGLKLASREKIIFLAEGHASTIHRLFFEKNIYFNVTEVASKIPSYLNVELDKFTNSILRALLVSSDHLKKFSYATYLERKSFVSLKKRALEYQIQQRAEIIISIILWKIIRKIVAFIYIFNIKSLGIYEKRHKIKKNIESIIPALSFGLQDRSHKYGAEVVKYAQGRSTIYLIYVGYLKYISKKF